MIEVAAGVIRDDKGRVLLCRRTGAHAGMWEFPGGKREAGESFADCLTRELREELELDVTAGERLFETEIADGERMLRLVFLAASADMGQRIVLHAHSEFAWVEPSEVAAYPLCGADALFAQTALADERTC